MVLFFTSAGMKNRAHIRYPSKKKPFIAVFPSAVIYMGRDKVESEEKTMACR